MPPPSPRSRTVRLLRLAAAVVLVLGAALLVRALLAPDWHGVAYADFEPTEIDQLRRLIDPARLDRADLARRVTSARFLLVGETHFKNETVTWLLGLLDELEDGRSLVLLLELPRPTQGAIDAYLDSGDERHFAEIWGEHEALPYHPILRWARAHRERVARVIAFDEERWRTVVARALLDDTRNETMAAALATAAAEHPAARIVAYGGSMHLMLGGRYRFDVENRRPAGARLLDLGVPRDQVVSIALDGDEMPLAPAWPGGTALDLGSAAGLLPYQYFHVYPIYRAARIGELHDYFVQLGPLTGIEPWRPPGAATD